MKSDIRLLVRRREKGQTIIVAMIILGLLMIIGFVYIGIVNRNILTTNRMQQRSIANDLSEAGIRYAHAQLLNSGLGADWRGSLTGPEPARCDPADTIPYDCTSDPDAYYLRPPSPYAFRAGTSQPDLGGPDGLGQYTRVQFNNGRALVRVRYAPSDINIFSPSPTGAMRSPGQVRNYLIIESVGRTGRINPNDPSAFQGTPVQYQNYASDTQLYQNVASMEAGERKFASRAINRAFASIGVIETARYITNKYQVSRPAEFGVSPMLGARYKGQNVAVDGVPLPLELGAFLPLYTVAANPTITTQAYPGFGSMFVNGDLRVEGNVVMNLNRALGDKLAVAGSVAPADATSSITFRVTEGTGAPWTVTTNQLAGPALDSRGAFTTLGSLFLDGMSGFDAQGYPRGVGAKPAPSMLAKDPETGETRYIAITRDSGVQVGQVNSGVFGHGTGIYVNNASDRQVPEDEVGRQAAGSASSLVYDWLNPNNGQPGSAWRGFFYVPPAAYLQLLPDGFSIIRNGLAPDQERTWRLPDGSDTSQSSIRYRLGLAADGQVHIINTFTPGIVNINGQVGAADFARGPVFNGVLYFAGNVRVRGIIPTDTQITVVSNASIYIEGSITKGVLGNGLQQGLSRGARIQRPSSSMLMLMARDYVTLNTTQFFGPMPSQAVDPVSDLPNTPGFTPVRVRTGEQFRMQYDFSLDPNGQTANPNNPATWGSYAADYYEFRFPSAPSSNKITTSLLMAHTMEDGPASAAFIENDVNPGVPGVSTYFFPKSATNLANNVAPPGDTTTPMYGLGGEPYQRYGKFESILFPLVEPQTVNTTDQRYLVANNVNGTYLQFAEGQNELVIKTSNYGGIPTNDYLIGKLAILPHDIKIEATLFAEEGSFFVIPGQWFNPNPNDRRDTYDALGTTPDERAQRRLENFGSYPGMPFYGEPADVRISIVGAISENMPATIDQQSQWMKKWGWIPRELGATGMTIPDQHVPYDQNLATPTYRRPGATWDWVPNLIVSYDPVLATARVNGFNNDPATNPFVRTDEFGRALPPLPRLPVGPALAFFGEVR
jgi:hypothetical protein